MADAFAALQVGFDGYQTFPYRTADPGRLEADDFYINDIALRIPPEAIRVQKRAFNHEWNTLRTAVSQKAKSGHSQARVSFSLIFKVSDQFVMWRLMHLVAGLRATPFCVVHNLYLDRVLGTPDAAGPVATATRPTNKTIQFRPIMLALSSMTFSTLGHEGKPDCIRGDFDFMWFNYLPLTKTIAFKAEPHASRPGHAWESRIWYEFYKPLAAKATPITWPHKDGVKERITEFMWREFLTVPRGDPTATALAKELADTLQKKPGDVLDEMNLLISNALSSDKPNPGLLTEGVLDTLTRRLVKKGVVNLSDSMHQQLQDLKKGSITAAAGDILFPLLKEMDSKKNIVSKDLDKIKGVVATLHKRAKALQGIAQRGDIGVQFATEGQYTKLKDHDTIYGKGKAKVRTGGLQLYGRKNRFWVTHSLDDQTIDKQAAIIQQIVVSFENVLASIPMVGYRYPLLQHVGSMDARVSMVINAKNEAAGEINKMYDTVDTMALRYKQIPQGFTNLYVKNDFLGLFGLDEFITEEMTTETLPDQPGRSTVALMLTQAGVTSSTRLNDPEDLQQERVSGDIGAFKAAWNVINKNLVKVAGSKIDSKWPSGSLLGIINSSGTKYKPTEAQHYYRKIQKVAGSNRSAAFYGIVAETRDAYNEFVKEVHDRIFGGMGNQEGQNYYSALLELKTQSKSWGYIPGMDQIVADVNARIAAYRRDGNYKKIRTAGIAKSNKALKQEAAAHRQVRRLKGEDFTNQKGSKAEAYSTMKTGHLTEVVQKRNERISELGVNRYLLKMRKVFAKATGELRTLDEFKEVLEIVHSKGLGKGIMAYPDFKPQLESVAGFYEGKSSNAILMKYEPDCYLWYDSTNGGSTSPLSGIVDDYYISEAKRYSLNVWKNAQESVDGFFKTKYHDALRDPTHMGPYNVLTKDFASNELAQPFYGNSDMVNATRATGVQISKSVVCDPNSKFPVNWYPADASQRVLQGSQINTHTTDLEKLWTGVGQSTGDDAGSTLTPDGTISAPNIPSQPRASGKDTGPVPSFYPWGRKRTSRTVRQFTLDMLEACKQLGLSQNSAMILTAHAAHSSGWGQSAENYRLCGIKITRGQRARGLPYTVKTGWECVGKSGRRVRGKRSDSGTAGCPPGTVRKYAPMYWRAYRTLKEGVGGVLSLLKSRHKPAYNALLKGDTSYFRDLRQTGWYTADANKFHTDAMRRLKLIEQIAKGGGLGRRRVATTKQQQKIDAQKAEPLSRSVTSTVSSPMREAIRDFEEDLYNGQGQGLMRAYPTFKLYFIEDDSGDRRRLAFDDFFSYGAVQSIRVVRSRKIAADYCELMLTNVSGVLSNRKFRQDQKGSDEPHTAGGQVSKEARSNMKSDTREENPIASLLLQEGIDIHLKLGYTSDPDRLGTVFNGTIVEVQFSENEDLVRVVAQSHAIELVQDLKGTEKPASGSPHTSFNSSGAKPKTSSEWFGWDFWGFTNDAATGRILEEMLAEPEVLHFGRWTPSGGGYGATASRDLLTQRWTFTPRPADDNIFAPSPTQDMDTLGDGTFFKNMQYIIYRTTIWDIFQEMTLRHPNFIASPVPYRDKGSERMTMFFGLPNQLYFARHPTADEERKDAKLKAIQDKAVAKYFQSFQKQFQKKSTLGKVTGKAAYGIAALGAALSPAVSQAQARVGADWVLSTAVKQAPITKDKTLENVVTNFYRQARLEEAKKAGYVKPFRNYHLVTSSNHIICNNIRASKRDVANTIVIKYGEDVEIKDGAGSKIDGVSIKGDEQEFTLKLDCALPTEEIRTQMGQFINVTNEELAKRYALGLLIRNLKDIYKGELIVIGNPRIKPYDVCYIFDEYTDMIGPIEVEEVHHVFDQQHGYRTEIKPDMLVQAAEWSLLSAAEALGVVMEGTLRKVFGAFGGPPGKALGKNVMGGAGVAGAAVSALSFGTGLTTLGGFLGKKIINYTQLAQPVVMSPLMHHGRIFAGGVPTRKIPTSAWDTMFADWNASADVGYTDWKEDWTDETMGWLRSITGQHTVGDFFSNGGESPE